MSGLQLGSVAEAGTPGRHTKEPLPECGGGDRPVADAVLLLDQGTEFLGEFRDRANQFGILIHAIGARAPRQNGRERHGDLFKAMMEKTLEQPADQLGGPEASGQGSRGGELPVGSERPSAADDRGNSQANGGNCFRTPWWSPRCWGKDPKWRANWPLERYGGEDPDATFLSSRRGGHRVAQLEIAGSSALWLARTRGGDSPRRPQRVCQCQRQDLESSE